MAVDGRFKKFSKAVTVWLQSSADLIALTGHTSGDPRIGLTTRGSDTVRKYPSCVFWFERSLPAVPEVNVGLYESLLFVEARATDEPTLFDIIEAVENLMLHSVTEPSFTGSGVKTESIINLGTSGDAFGEADLVSSSKGALQAILALRVFWRATT